MENTLFEIQEDGLLLIMLDGTKWRVSDGENTKSITWLPIDAVVIEERRDGSYLITRRPDGDSVTARPDLT